MKKRIFIDSNVWDLLHDYNIDLSIELPKDEFQLLITGRISFEVKEIQDYSKKNFIDNAIENWPIEIDKLFSMADERFPIEEQRDGGFGFRLSDGFRPYFLHMKNHVNKGKRNQKTGHYKNETDSDLAMRAFEEGYITVVLTLDKKAGPLRDAHNAGKPIVFLNDFKDKLSKDKLFKKGDLLSLITKHL